LENSIVDLIVSLISSSLRISIPITFAALGAVFAERSGIISLGLEGMMLSGAFFGALGSYLTNNAYIGLLFAMLGGGVFGLIHAVLTVKFKTEHVISGVGINLLGQGLTTVLLQVIWGNRGKSPEVAGIGTVTIPFIKDVPFLGKILGNISPLFIIMIAVIIISWVILYKTVFGLRVRVIGENPQAADTLGIDVYKIQYICVILSGILAGIGGAYLSIGDINMFGRDMAAGRGYIAVAATIFGGWNPAGVFGGSLLFGLAQSLQIRLQVFKIPVQFVQMLPYIVTILVLAVSRKNQRGPGAVGKHFRRGEA
jgi:simple sugar transport system permease protein